MSSTAYAALTAALVVIGTATITGTWATRRRGWRYWAHRAGIRWSFAHGLSGVRFGTVRYADPAEAFIRGMRTARAEADDELTAAELTAKAQR